MFTILQRMEIRKPHAKIMQMYRNNTPISTIINEMLKHDILVLPMSELFDIIKTELPDADLRTIEHAVAIKVRYISRCYFHNYRFLQ